jgi:EpsI family protein
MALTRIRYWLAGIAMAFAAAMSIALEPSPVPLERRPVLESMIPEVFGEWRIDPSIVPIPPSPDVAERLDVLYNQMISRTYVNKSGERIMLVAAYGGEQSDTLKAHRQEVCYASQGFQVKGLTDAVLRVEDHKVPVTRFVASSRARQEQVTYWFTVGNRIVRGRGERLMMQLKYGLSGEIPDGMLVRVSNLSADQGAAFSVHQEFLRAMLATMAPSEVNRLIGGSATSARN